MTSFQGRLKPSAVFILAFFNSDKPVDCTTSNPNANFSQLAANKSAQEEIPSSCPKPCQILSYEVNQQVSFQWSGRYTKVEISLPEKVEVSRAQYSYTAMQVGAELGGWIGLLFGLSILDLFDLGVWIIKKFIQKIRIK